MKKPKLKYTILIPKGEIVDNLPKISLKYDTTQQYEDIVDRGILEIKKQICGNTGE